jgi:hypothetical protein
MRHGVAVALVAVMSAACSGSSSSPSAPKPSISVSDNVARCSGAVGVPATAIVDDTKNGQDSQANAVYQDALSSLGPSSPESKVLVLLLNESNELTQLDGKALDDRIFNDSIDLCREQYP